MKEQQVIPRSATLPDEVARRLRQSIESGALKPGDRLPTQHELSRTFGVSRPVVREAISLLKSEGLVTSQQGRGQFVSEDGSRVFRLQPNLGDGEDLARLLEFLMSVEVTATELAAARRTDADLAGIRDALDDLGRAVRDGTSGVEEDMRFHQAILRACHNHYFRSFGEFLDVQVRRLIRAARANTARLGGLTFEVHREHEAIFDAIARRDGARARAAAALHLTNAGARLGRYGGEAA